MRGRFFLDTNILVYADDLDAGPKRERAREILRAAFHDAAGVLSTQVLQEYYVVATRKLGVSAVAARRKVELLTSLDVVTLRADLVLSAIDLCQIRAISFWDALILRAASTAGCTVLYTEDLNAGEIVDGVRIEDPFAGLS